MKLNVNLYLFYQVSHAMAHSTGVPQPSLDDKADLTCYICLKSSSNKSNLKRHLRLHKGQYTNYCVTCGKGFMDLTKLKYHQLSKH